MHNYEVVILVPETTAAPTGEKKVTVQAESYEEDIQTRIVHFYRGAAERRMRAASFKTWDYIIRTADAPGPPT